MEVRYYGNYLKHLLGISEITSKFTHVIAFYKLFDRVLVRISHICIQTSGRVNTKYAINQYNHAASDF